MESLDTSIEEGVYALQEAIRLAQHSKNSLLLEHALAWLHKLHPYSGEDVLVILNKYVKNSVELKVPPLGVWGRLQQAKTKLELAQEPQSVVATVMASETQWGAQDDVDCYKGDVKGQRSTMSFLATTWDYYGKTSQGVLNCQLLCHMMSCDSALSPSADDEEEGVALSLSMMARYLADVGHFDDGKKVLERSKKIVLSSKGSQIISLCLEELLFDHCLLIEAFDSAQCHLNNITVLDHLSALYRSALYWKAKGNMHKAMDITRDCLQRLSPHAVDSVCYKTRCLVLLSEIYSTLGLPALALPHIMDCLTLCDNYYLPSHQAKLSLAHLQLQMGSPADCMETLKKCMLQTQCKGMLWERGRAHLLMAQANLLISKEKNQILSKDDAVAVCPLFTVAVQLYQAISARAMTRNVLLLQVNLLNYVGLTDEKNRLLMELKHV